MKKKLKKLLVMAVILAMGGMLSAYNFLGIGSRSSKKAYSYTYVAPSGNEYSGSYKGNWEGDKPSGEGTFSGKGKNGEVTIQGTWKDGQPHGKSKTVRKYDTGITTYNSEFQYGEPDGMGVCEITDLKGNPILSYSGNFRSGKYHGDNGKYDYYYSVEDAKKNGVYHESYSGQYVNGKRDGKGEVTWDYTTEFAKENGFDCKKYKGQFSNGSSNGDGQLVIYYTAEFTKQKGIDYLLWEGQYSDGIPNGTMQKTYHYTDKAAKELGWNYKIYAGEYQDGQFKEPYSCMFLNGNSVVEEGTVKNGKYVNKYTSALGKSASNFLFDLAEKNDGWIGKAVRAAESIGGSDVRDAVGNWISDKLSQ